MPEGGAGGVGEAGEAGGVDDAAAAAPAPVHLHQLRALLAHHLAAPHELALQPASSVDNRSSLEG